ncbi:MAG: ATP-binding protein [Clostridia bacterium]|nr:ATP-binding protein [Clostridia bacterium]
MITKEATYKKAFENIKESLNLKTAAFEKAKALAYDNNSRLYEIDNELSVLGAKLVTAALTDGKEGVDALKETSKKLTEEKNAILKSNGVEPIKYSCNACMDTGYIGGKICECVRREAARVMADELSREMPLIDSKFEDFDLKYYSDKTDENGQNPRRRMTAILKLCKEYVLNFDENTKENLLFMGDAGLGKTHLTLAIVSGVIEKGYLPVYGSAENLFSTIEAEKFAGEGRGSYEAILNCDLLVIDDLGAEMATSFTKSVLYNLVNTRILTRKPTIINTNLSMKQIEERYTPRISSRLIGNYEGQKFIGRDIRQQKRLESI